MRPTQRSDPGVADPGSGSHTTGAIFPAPSFSAGPRPFTLVTLASRFAPAVTDPSELRERGGARVRVVTAAGLRVGLATRVFARDPLLPSDVEAEEEQQVKRSEAYRCSQSARLARKWRTWMSAISRHCNHRKARRVTTRTNW